MSGVKEPVERAIGLFAAILLVLIVDYLRPSPSPADRISVEVTILRVAEQPDRTIDVTVEIANRSDVELADNRLFVVPSNSGGRFHESVDGTNRGSGTATADDPPGDTPVRELEGAFNPLPPNSSVKIAFTVPAEIARQEPLYVIFQSVKIRYDNTEETRVISVTEPLPASLPAPD